MKRQDKASNKKFSYKQLWFLYLAVSIYLFCNIWQLSKLWIIRSTLANTNTYPNALVLNTKVGDLGPAQLETKLSHLKSSFDDHWVTITNSKQKTKFVTRKIGLTLNQKQTSQLVWKLNRANIVDKFLLQAGMKSPIIAPIINIDKDACRSALSVINIPKENPKDAEIYFDKEPKVKPDRSGRSFDVDMTCQNVRKKLAAGDDEIAVSFDITPAKIPAKGVKDKIIKIKAMAGKPLTLKTDKYQQILSPEQLVGMIEINKNSKGVQVNWSVAKLDTLVTDIASEVDINNSDSPSLSACQYLINTSGNWLDRDATKKIFEDLATNNKREYNLPIVFHEASIGTRVPVKNGTAGTVYLTFDDGMTFANQIMDYASCYGIKVTFFETGMRAADDAVALRRAVNEGHAVQSHGYEHAATNYASAHDYSWQNNDIAQSISAITNITGIRPTYFRPPGGNRSPTTYTAAAANGINVILWGVTAADTVETFGQDAICANVVNGAFDGASILMHSTKQKTANAVPCIIEGLAAKGYNMQALR